MQAVCLLRYLSRLKACLTIIANALGIFSPVITFALFAIIASLKGESLDAETAFTTTALLGLVTHPANMIMTIIPQAIASLAAFARIQDYLLQQVGADQRHSLPSKTESISRSDRFRSVCFQDVTVHHSTSMRSILRNVNFSLNGGSITICAGTVGSGKTVLAKCIIGDIQASSGKISVSSKRFAYCEQSPWLPRGTIKSTVCGFEKFDDVWYREVIRLCCLDEDISTMPDGHDTNIGSRGIKLSGGQRQRVV